MYSDTETRTCSLSQEKMHICSLSLYIIKFVVASCSAHSLNANRWQIFWQLGFFMLV